jgi:integrase
MFLQRPSMKVSELVSKVYPGQKVNPNLLQFFENYRLIDVSPLLIEEYKTFRQKAISNASVNRELSVLKHCFSQAVKWGLIAKNPTQGVSMLKETSRTRYLSYEEEERLLSGCPQWLGEIVLFALHSGMRMGEILSLLWADIDLTQKTILVRQSKNGLPRSVPMNRVIFDLLSSKEKRQPLERVFPVNKNTLSKTFHSVCQELGIEDFRFHDLRHSFSTRLSQSGCNVFQIMSLLGHKSISMTARYSHFNTESLRSVVNQLAVNQS